MDHNPSTPRTKTHVPSNLSPTSSNQDGQMRPPASPVMPPNQRTLSESLRGGSPRTQRQPSIGHSALQELLNNPPLAHQSDNKFSGRDWRKIAVGEIVDTDEVHWVESDTSVEDCTNVC